MADPFEELAAAHRAMLAAERKRDRIAKQHRTATAEVKATYADRMAKLRAATAEGTPAVMRRASEAMGITLARVYQMLREYDQRQAAGPQPDRRKKGR